MIHDSNRRVRNQFFGSIKELDLLQGSHLKNDHSLGVPFLVSYDVELRCEGLDKLFKDMSRRYIIALVWQTGHFSPLKFPLIIIVEPPSR